MEEIWKEIKGYEGFYEVSNLGRVRSVDRIIKNHLYFGKIKKPSSNGKYLQIKLNKMGKADTKYIHRLVAEMFLGFNTNADLEINHIDHNKLNNNVNNLEIVTRKENIEKSLTFYNGITNKYGFFKLVDNFYCIDCGIKISKHCIRCKKCSIKKAKEEKLKSIPENLLDEINKSGVCKVARKYHVSHTTIRRWKDKLGRVL